MSLFSFEVMGMSKSKSILLDKEGFEISLEKAVWKIFALKRLKKRDPELFEANGCWHDLLLLEQFVKLYGKWNGEKCEVAVLNEAENKLLNCKIEKVTPETYPCGVLIKALEA
jgi:hypothetical protein